MSPSAFALTRSRAKRAVVHFTGKSLEIPIHAVNPSQLFRARHTTDLEGSLPRSLFAPHWQKNKHKPQVGGPRPRPPRPMSSVPDVGAGVVLQGTCGWSDESILRSRRFYPSSVRTSEDRLFHYARHFPCVEVDSSTYAIPSPKTCASWASQTPRGFVFHVKAYGPFCSRSCVVGALPRAVRERVLEEGLARDAKATIPLQELPEGAEMEVWEAFNRCLDPLIEAKKMGVCVFQFHLGFVPSEETHEYLRHLRSMLRPDVSMAMEFRDRAWFDTPARRDLTVAALRDLDACLVAGDDLASEMGAGGGAGQLPVAEGVATPRFWYVRIHRRRGTWERQLGAAEVEAWVARLGRVQAQGLRGPVFFMWGTDWEDVPIRNASVLETALPAAMRFNWRAQLREREAAQPGSLMAMLAGGRGKRLREEAADRDVQKRQAGGGEGFDRGRASCADAGVPGSGALAEERGEAEAPSGVGCSPPVAPLPPRLPKKGSLLNYFPRVGPC